jgi:thiol:disulfide interchange protein DsbD
MPTVPRPSLALPLLATLALLAVAPAPLAATSTGPVRGEQLALSLLAEDSALVPGRSHWLALKIEHDPHWHTYWLNPGDSGLPTRIAWTLPEGIQAGAIAWPWPSRLPVGPLVNFGYEGETWLLTQLQVAPGLRPGAADLELLAKVDYLVCREECIPGTSQLRLALPVADQAAPVQDHAAGFREARRRLPATGSGLGGTVRETGDGLEVVLTGPVPERFELFAHADSVFASASFAGWRRDGASLVARHPRNDSYDGLPAVLDMLLVDTGSDPVRSHAFSLVAGGADDAPVADGGGDRPTVGAAPVAPGDVAPTSLLLALLLAFAGGVILNLMPCVFPILSMKALTLAQAGSDGGRARREAWLYTAGVLASFAVIGGLLLALRGAGAQVGWGFQLQSPWLVAALAWLMVLLGLGLSGALTLGSGWMNLGQRLTHGGGDRAAFFTGVLACVVAAPCTAPFMGTALGYALTQPAPLALAVFLMLGLGLAAPMALLALAPGLARRLPRPGAWMETFKQVLAFPLYLTAVWLFWVLGRQTGVDGLAVALIGLVLLVFAAWLWQHAGRRGGGGGVRVLALAVAVLAVLALALPQRLAPGLAVAEATAGAEVWSPQRLAQLRSEGTPVLVNMTAAWCITCLANERMALSSAAFGQRLAQHGIAYLKGDWTRHDEVITDYLGQFGRAGVPLYVLYPRGGGAPELLPQLLTPGAVLAALDRAAAGPSE